MVISKKGISPIISVTLILFVVVIGVANYQDWYLAFNSKMMADSEVQINEVLDGDIEIVNAVGSILYVANNRNYDLSIDELKIGDTICFVSNNLTPGINEINIRGCITNESSLSPDILLISNGHLFQENNVFIDNSFNLDCSTLDNGEWIKVPGNSLYETNDFCVMKYEAKNVGGIAKSTATDTIWASVTWQQSQDNCENLGAGYHLITDDEWLTIARNAEQVASNWNSSVVGSGFMYSGHNDNGPSNALLADTDDSNGYFGTNDNLTDCDGLFNLYSNDNVGSRACAGQRRTLVLSNGEVIWDLAGNVWEWVNDSMPIASRYHGGDQEWMSYNSDDGTGKVASLVPALKAPSSGWNANNGMGRYADGYNLTGTWNEINEAPDFCTEYCSPTVVFFRGGYWAYGPYSGMYTLTLDNGPSDAGTYGGFRCTYTP